MVKNPPADAGDLREWVQSLGGEDPLGKGMAPYSIAWRAMVHMVAKSRRQLKQLSMHTRYEAGLQRSLECHRR